MSSNTISREHSKSISPIFQFVQGVGKVAGGTILGVTMLSSSILAGGLVGLALSFRNLPDVRSLRSYVPTETSYIYDVNGELLTRIHDEANREVVPLDKIATPLKMAVLAIEDSHFYQHAGINPNSVGRALLANIEGGGVREGASTVTMQLVKNLFLSPERKLSRKVAEAVLAMRLEQILTKDEILELYLNQVYWGHNTYGVETAAQSYFAKSAEDLTLAESAMMAGLIQAPESYSPFIDYKLAKRQQAIVLARMRALDWITAEQEKEAKEQPLLVGRVTSFGQSKVPYLTEAVIQELSDRFGRDMVLKGGLRIQTTIDLKLQRIAESTVKKWHNRLYNQGLYYDYDNGQLALVAVDPRTHFVKAMVGGFDYETSQYNRAVQAQRQPGSSFKPFVYYAAFASGKYTPDSIVNDSPVRYRDGDGYYSPRNYGGSFSGAVSLRKSLEVSLNIPAIKIGQSIGLSKVVEVVRNLGVKSPIEPVISLPLGSVDMTPLEMAGAFATFANNGWHSTPTFIAQVTDSNGNVLLDNTPKPQLVLDPWAVASLNSTLRGVIERGTATSARMGRPAAGKTGTTSSERDIWFVGYVPQMSVAVWVGNDDYRPLAKGATGGTHVAPIWRDFMRQAMANEPVENFRSPGEFPRPQP
ncbi:transglycosylase domain-containing protein [Roseofilum casamattae]|uniref:Penicillin-binding protein 1A n=1 Tax=Roseofilum casamattae BLCC-M143 TaxID=3022442 RepID=A0ABT7BRT2_9CYAN|nr:penicillin-binding protein 1A [Roseofilum casamattae]MDJ1181902.1 penicillin-binding protein 1A [Roseofilum casamattae BLCC-M143]